MIEIDGRYYKFEISPNTQNPDGMPMLLVWTTVSPSEAPTELIEKAELLLTVLALDEADAQAQRDVLKDVQILTDLVKVAEKLAAKNDKQTEQ